jgi:hypothetical protein
MASQSTRPDKARQLLNDLLASQSLIERLESTAPETCKGFGGGARLLEQYGHVTGASFWGLNLPAHDPEAVGLWEAMAKECTSNSLASITTP